MVPQQSTDVEQSGLIQSEVVENSEPLGKAEQAYLSIRQRILSGQYTPGYRLVLSRIANELGVSVVPVREAIRRLEAEHLVTFERNVGAMVAGIDPGEYLVTMQTLSIVEGAATGLALPLITPDDLTGAHRINEQMRQSLSDFDPPRFTVLNRQFHELLYHRCPNSHLLDLVNRGWARLEALRESTFNFIPGRAAESVTEHHNLLELIESGASALEVELASRNHRLGTLNTYLSKQSPTSEKPEDLTEEKQ